MAPRTPAQRMTYDWRFDVRQMAYRLTATQGDRYAAVLIDPNPPSGWHHLSDIAMALREATRTLTERNAPNQVGASRN